MTIAFESGYTLPGADLPLNHARILHDGNRFRPKTVTASAAATNYPGLAADNGTTVDRWRPFANDADSPLDFSDTDVWTATNLTVSSDGRLLTETTANGEHDISQAHTFTAVEHVVAFKVERQTMPEVQVRANDGTSSFTCFFDLRDGSVGTASGCTGQIQDLGRGQFLLSIYFTAAAGTGVIELLGSSGAEDVTYVGSTSNTIRVLQAYVHPSAATLRYELHSAQQGDVFALAAHNLGTGNARLQLQHDSNTDNTWTTLGTLTPSDDSPIFFIIEPLTSIRWGISIDRGVMPEVSVFRVGKLLQMQRPFYGGHAPTRINRSTEVIGNMSGNGGLLGRSRKRTILSAEYRWNNLTYDWVRANLDGPTGLVQAAEIEPLFVAWRSGVTQDVDYVMRASAGAPRTIGTRDLMSFEMDGEVFAYE